MLNGYCVMLETYSQIFVSAWLNTKSAASSPSGLCICPSIGSSESCSHVSTGWYWCEEESILRCCDISADTIISYVDDPGLLQTHQPWERGETSSHRNTVQAINPFYLCVHFATIAESKRRSSVYCGWTSLKSCPIQAKDNFGKSRALYSLRRMSSLDVLHWVHSLWNLQCSTSNPINISKHSFVAVTSIPISPILQAAFPKRARGKCEAHANNMHQERYASALVIRSR